MSTTTDFGNMPNYFMPVIEPPVNGADPSTYYLGLNLTVTATDLGNDGLNFVFANPLTPLNNYLMVDGNVHFIKSGDNFPSNMGFLAGTPASYDSLIVHTNPISCIDLKKQLPAGIPPPEFIIIENIDEVTFTADITAHINDIITNQASYNNGKSSHNSVTIIKLLDLFWLEKQGTDPALALLSDKVDLFIINMKQGPIWLSCKAGLKLGTILNNVNNDADFTIKMLQMSDVNLIPPFKYLRQMTSLPNLTLGGERWTDHPLITSVAAFTAPLDIYLKFEVWNPLSINDPAEDEYVPVDMGCEVKLMDYDPINGDYMLGTAFTNASGIVEWHFPNVPVGGSGDSNPDLYFIISNPSCAKIDQYNLTAPSGSTITFPVQWSTKANTGADYWESVDGSPGYMDNFNGIRLGASVNPMTFRIGVDYHFKLKSIKGPKIKRGYDQDVAFISGINIKITDGFQIFESRQTNDEGEIYNLSFNIPPNRNIYVELDFEIEDSTINLQTTRVAYKGTVFPPAGLSNAGRNSIDVYTWKSKDEDPSSRFYFENNSKTTLKSQEVKRDINNISIDPIRHFPIELKPEKDDAYVPLFILKTIKELHIFLHTLTNGQWLGRPVDLKMYHFFDFFPGAQSRTTGTSYPNGVVWLATTWDRATVIHEYSHQIMWQQSNYSDSNIVDQFVWDGVHDFSFFHYTDGYSTEQRTLTEGWAASIEAIFTSNNPYSLYKLRTGEELDIDSTNSNLDLGYHSEGAFSNILVLLFWKYVVEQTDQLKWKLLESPNGNLTHSTLADNQWLIGANINNIRDNFINIIWNPLTDLSSKPISLLKTSDSFVENVKNNNSGSGSPNIWYKLRSEFLLWNTAINGFGSFINTIKAPTISTIVPNVGPISGLNNVVITGSNYFKQSSSQNSFRNTKINVYFGTSKVPAPSTTILTENDIMVVAPAASGPGLVDIKLEFFVRNKVVHTEILITGYQYA